MKLLITGSRTCTQADESRLAAAMANALLAHDDGQPLEVLTGGAKGADTLAAGLVREANAAAPEYLPKTTLTELLPDYARHGAKAAPLVRNAELVRRADVVLALYAPGRERKGGTWDTVQKALSAGKPVLECWPDGRARWAAQPPALL